jgi:BTB/POZ domain-containing protein 9
MEELDILLTVRSSKLFSDTALVDALTVQITVPNWKLPHRGRLLLDENVASQMLGAQVLQGEMRSYLLNGDTHNYDMERGYTRHTITDAQEHGILIQLGTQYIINHIKMLLWDRDMRSYSYYIEVYRGQFHIAV